MDAQQVNILAARSGLLQIARLVRNCEAMHGVSIFAHDTKYGFRRAWIFVIWGVLMERGFAYFFNSVLMGVGLAMDAFSVSLANGLNEPCMSKRRMSLIAGVFAFFQALMPMLGWVCIHTIVQYFQAFEKLIPWIALVLLGWIGGKMLYEGSVRRGRQEEAGAAVGGGALLMQGVATSIDALSVGFTIEGSGLAQALAASAIIAAVTFCICAGGLLIGRKFGTRLAGSASLLGGAILVLIGLEIFLKNLQ